MFINKIGQHHLELGENCQDFGKYEIFENMDEMHKLVCDGCSEGKHSEVGAKLYTLLNKQPVDLWEAFPRIINLIGENSSIIKDYMCFTILDCRCTNEEFHIHYCGDGFIITENNNNEINFIKLDDGEYPKYYAYNFVSNKTALKQYREGVFFSQLMFSRTDYKNIGVASDGIRYILNCEDENLKNEFISILKEDKEVKMKRFINKHQSIFKDDITIAF